MTWGLYWCKQQGHWLLRAGEIQNDCFVWWLCFFFLLYFLSVSLGREDRKLEGCPGQKPSCCLIFKPLQACFLSSVDKTGFCHCSDEDKKTSQGRILICLLCYLCESKRALIKVEQSFPQPSCLNDELSRAQAVTEVSRTREYQSCHFLSATCCQPGGKWLQGGTLLFDGGDGVLQPFLPSGLLSQKLGWRMHSGYLSPRCSAASSKCRTSSIPCSQSQDTALILFLVTFQYNAILSDTTLIFQ